MSADSTVMIIRTPFPAVCTAVTAYPEPGAQRVAGGPSPCTGHACRRRPRARGHDRAPTWPYPTVSPRPTLTPIPFRVPAQSRQRATPEFVPPACPVRTGVIAAPQGHHEYPQTALHRARPSCFFNRFRRRWSGHTRASWRSRARR